MTTITIQESIELPKTQFKNWEELYDVLLEAKRQEAHKRNDFVGIEDIADA